jgi:hypothetical protein
MHALIQSLWIGPELSRLEQLSIASFLKNGHPYELHVYDELPGIPAGTTVRDANDIIPEKYIFTTRGTSLACFSDWFRWELLYRNGNYWADMDMICLRPFDYADDIIFGNYYSDSPNISILKFPKGHPLPEFMASCCKHPNRILPYDSKKVRRRKLKRRLLGNRRNNIGWGEAGGPRGFKKALTHFDLVDRGLPFTAFYPIAPGNWDCVFDETLKADGRLFTDTRAIHLWNENIRRAPGFDKNARFPGDSLIEQLKAKYL